MKQERKFKFRNALRVKQKISWRRVAVTASIVTTAAIALTFFFNLSHSEKAFAIDCSGSYTLDWSIPATYSITCGTVVPAQWTVKKDTCTYSSPVNNVGGNPGDPAKNVDIAVRVGQSGNLTDNDYAWIYIFVNGLPYSTYTCRGDTLNGVFYVNQTITVPAAGNYQVTVKLKCDKSTEFWFIKNGEVTACVYSNSPLPVTLTAFTAKPVEGGVSIEWTTESEVNNDYFILSRSTDNKSYYEIKRMEGHGTTSFRNNYSFTDDAANAGINYYKLSQTDYDGTTVSYGPVAVRSGNSPETSIGKISVHPNPYRDNFTITFNSITDQPVIVSIGDSKGSIVEQIPVDVKAGSNDIPYTDKFNLAPGIYFVGIKTASQPLVFTKIIKK